MNDARIALVEVRDGKLGINFIVPIIIKGHIQAAWVIAPANKTVFRVGLFVRHCLSFP
jgi:hypothetical protein